MMPRVRIRPRLFAKADDVAEGSVSSTTTGVTWAQHPVGVMSYVLDGIRQSAASGFPGVWSGYLLGGAFNIPISTICANGLMRAPRRATGALDFARRRR